MIYWLAIFILVTGQSMDLYSDYYKIRKQPVKDWQQIVRNVGLQKAAIWIPIACTVWWLGITGAIVAGVQGFLTAIYKLKISK